MYKLEDVIDQNIRDVNKIIHAYHPVSRYDEFASFQLLVLRRLVVEKKSMHFQPEIFLLKSDDVYYLKSDGKFFIKLDQGIIQMSEMLEQFYSDNYKFIESYSYEIETLEEYLYERKIPGIFMDLWFDYKKDIAKIENFYLRNNNVYLDFLKKTEKKFPVLPDDLRAIEDTISFHISNIQMIKTRLDSVHHYYASIKNDRLNKSIFILTVISGLFLPLNLIVGFFGMNTDGMFFKDNVSGTKNVVILLCSIILIVLLGANVIRMLDRYILRFFLGRYDMYKNLLNRFDEFDKRLKGK
ncbi:MAG: hypothetical protein CVV49_01645 [Spirochaetae bacterium HGW-Spirochaetae-5]|nr:MAG: hypothetical protein CVV49_01645 [Spirochaetae bacterium HGW-Spirochaetae-5]